MAYIPTVWRLGDIITEEKMNKIENGIAEASQTAGIPGPEGPRGPKGDTGATGPQGPAGKSAYQSAVDNGFTGTEQQWLESLSMEGIEIRIVDTLPSMGEEKTLYFVTRTSSNTHDEYMWINGQWELIGDTTIDLSGYATTTYVDNAIENISLTPGPEGPKGDTGAIGPQGPAGITPNIGENGNWWIGETDTGVSAGGSSDGTGTPGPKGDPGTTFTPSVSDAGVLSWTNNGGLTNPNPVDIKGPQGIIGPEGPKGATGDTGPQGPKGDTGPQGKSAYQIAVDNGFTGTEQQWLESLAMDGIQVKVVNTLPTVGEEKILYFVTRANSNTHDEYMWINSKWELIGNTTIDLSDYATTTYVDNAISNISLTPGPQGPAGPRGETGATGPKGADGLTTAIFVNGSTYTQVNGTITLPDYPTNTVTSTAVSTIVAMTQAEYDALSSKDATTLYLVKE